MGYRWSQSESRKVVIEMRELAMIEFCDQGLRRGSKFFDYEEDQDTSKKIEKITYSRWSIYPSSYHT